MPKIIPLCVNGQDSITEFLAELIDKHPGQESQYGRKLMKILEEFESKGPLINKDHKNFIPFKKIKGERYDGIYEIRTKKCRFFIYKDDQNTFIGLHGFEKKSDKTPRNELEKARNEVLLWIKTKN